MYLLTDQDSRAYKPLKSSYYYKFIAEDVQGNNVTEQFIKDLKDFGVDIDYTDCYFQLGTASNRLVYYNSVLYCQNGFYGIDRNVAHAFFAIINAGKTPYTVLVADDQDSLYSRVLGVFLANDYLRSLLHSQQVKLLVGDDYRVVDFSNVNTIIFSEYAFNMYRHLAYNCEECFSAPSNILSRLTWTIDHPYYDVDDAFSLNIIFSCLMAARYVSIIDANSLDGNEEFIRGIIIGTERYLCPKEKPKSSTESAAKSSTHHSIDEPQVVIESCESYFYKAATKKDIHDKEQIRNKSDPSDDNSSDVNKQSTIRKGHIHMNKYFAKAGRVLDNSIGIDLQGNLLVKTDRGFVRYDAEKKEIINVMDFTMESPFVYILPSNQINVNDIILHNDKYYHIIFVEGDNITAINLTNSEEAKLIPESLMGMKFYYVVKSLLNFNNGQNNQFNPMMLLLMKDKLGSKLDAKYMLALNMLNQGQNNNANMNNNLMMLLLMSEKESLSTKDVLLLSCMQNNNNNVNNIMPFLLMSEERND